MYFVLLLLCINILFTLLYTLLLYFIYFILLCYNILFYYLLCINLLFYLKSNLNLSVQFLALFLLCSKFNEQFHKIKFLGFIFDLISFKKKKLKIKYCVSKKECLECDTEVIYVCHLVLKPSKRNTKLQFFYTHYYQRLFLNANYNSAIHL